jgi:hypothetical protein
LIETIASIGLIISFTLLFTIGVLSCLKGHRSDAIFAMAFSVFLISAFLCALYVFGFRKIGLLDTTAALTRWGFCLNLVLLSLAQAYRIVELREQQTQSAELAKIAELAKKNRRDQNRVSNNDETKNPHTNERCSRDARYYRPIPLNPE